MVLVPEGFRADQLWVFVWLAFYLLSFVFGMFCLWFLGFYHNIKVIIYSQRGNGLYIKGDIARRKKVGEVMELVMFFSKKTIPFPDLKYSYIKRGIFRKTLFTFYEDNVGNLHPLVMTKDPSKSIQLEPQNIKFWFTTKTWNAYQLWRKPNVFEKYGTVIASMTGFLLIFVLTLILFNQIDRIADKLGEVASAISSLRGPFT